MPGPETQPLFDEAAPPRRRLLPRLRRAHRPTGTATTRRCSSSGDGRDRRHATARSTSPATSTTSPTGPFQHPERHYFEPGPDGLRRLAGLRRRRRDDDLQRPALARDLPGDGPAGRRADPVRLQHADPLRARPEPGHPAGLPQRAGHAGRRLPERHVGGRRGQGRRRGGRRLAGPVLHRRPVGPDRGPGADHRRRADRRPAATSTGAGATRARCSTSTATAGPSSTAASPRNGRVAPPTARHRPQSDRRSSASPSTAAAVAVRADHPHLLAALREELDITSPKDGCSPSGQCGCCTVLVDGKAHGRRASCRWRRSTGGRSSPSRASTADERARYADAFAACGGAAVRLLHPRHRRAGQGARSTRRAPTSPGTTWPATSAPTSAAAPAT